MMVMGIIEPDPDTTEYTLPKLMEAYSYTVDIEHGTFDEDIDVEIMAIFSLAHSRCLGVRVESEYVPEAVYELASPAIY